MTTKETNEPDAPSAKDQDDSPSKGNPISDKAGAATPSTATPATESVQSKLPNDEVVLLRKVWCIAHTGKWCALMNGEDPENPPEFELTLCDHRHLVDLTSRYREPTCTKCRIVLGRLVADGVL